LSGSRKTASQTTPGAVKLRESSGKAGGFPVGLITDWIWRRDSRGDRRRSRPPSRQNATRHKNFPPSCSLTCTGPSQSWAKHSPVAAVRSHNLSRRSNHGQSNQRAAIVRLWSAGKSGRRFIPPYRSMNPARKRGPGTPDRNIWHHCCPRKNIPAGWYGRR